MRQHIFLSPHFDDAIFSCGGTIAQLARAGSASIVTVMGGQPPLPMPDTPLIRDLHQRWQTGDDPIGARQQEDQAAAARLGASLLQLPVPDCIYRTADGQPLYPENKSLWGGIDPRDRLEDWLTDTQPFETLLANADYLYAPLGVGNHVDHQIVRQWGLRLAAAHPHLNFQFYTDFPYMKDSGKISAALTHVNLTLQPRWIYLSSDDIHEKIMAMSCYDSQISTFWENHEAMQHDVQTSFRVQHDLWGERYWARPEVSH